MFAIKRNKENYNEINEYFSKLYNKNYTGKGYFKGECLAKNYDHDWFLYPKLGEKAVFTTYIPYGYRDTPFEDFKKVIENNKIYNNNNNMKKKIVGYISPMDLYDGDIKKGDVLSTNFDDPYAEWEINGKSNSDLSIPKEIVLTWEPVYKNSIKQISIGTPKFDVFIEGGLLRIPQYLKTINLEDIEKYVDKVYSLKTNSIFGEYWVKGIVFHIGCKNGPDITLNDLERIIKTSAENK